MQLGRAVKFIASKAQAQTNKGVRPCTYGINQTGRIEAIRSGNALRSHARSAHKGEVLLTCLGCVELQRKQEELNGHVPDPVYSESYATS